MVTSAATAPDTPGKTRGDKSNRVSRRSAQFEKTVNRDSIELLSEETLIFKLNSSYAARKPLDKVVGTVVTGEPHTLGNGHIIVMDELIQAHFVRDTKEDSPPRTVINKDFVEHRQGIDGQSKLESSASCIIPPD